MGRTYQDLGLDANLRSLSGPVASQRLSPYEVDSAINPSRGYIDYSRIAGGTIVLGGTNNGNGALIIRDDAGGTIVNISSDGIQVTGTSGSAFNLQSGAGPSAKLTFTRSDDVNKFAQIYLVEGGASPFDFVIDKSGSLNTGNFYVGNARNWSTFTVNVDLSAELLGGGTAGGTSVRLSVGNGTMTVDFGGTRMMSLNSTGDLKVRGTLGTGITSF